MLGYLTPKEIEMFKLLAATDRRQYKMESNSIEVQEGSVSEATDEDMQRVFADTGGDWREHLARRERAKAEAFRLYHAGVDAFSAISIMDRMKPRP